MQENYNTSSEGAASPVGDGEVIQRLATGSHYHQQLKKHRESQCYCIEYKHCFRKKRKKIEYLIWLGNDR